jgi:uncharacterized cupin superfamily protein
VEFVAAIAYDIRSRGTIARGEKMSAKSYPVAIAARDAPPRAKKTIYPEPFAARVANREKRVLGEVFGLTNFGVNLTRLAPGAVSALRHAHTRQDEFVYIIEGTPVLVTDSGETALQPGMCAGFKAASGDAHHLVNRSDSDVVYLEIGDRAPGDAATYPDDDLAMAHGADGALLLRHKNGAPY